MVSAPASTLELLAAQAAELSATLGRALDHATLKYDDINARSRGTIYIGWNPYRWDTPRDGAQRHFGDAREQWRALEQIATQAITLSAPERLKRLNKHATLFQRIIEQDDGSGAPGKSIDAIRERVDRATDDVIELLRGLPSADRDGGTLLVPDTNALIYKPDLAKWSLAGGRWTIVLVPQVLRELDALKQRPNVAEKASGVIRRIKEYARRGDTFKGVKIAGDVWLREIAIDPVMSASLPWLQSGHGDDEMLASVLELRCHDLRAAIAIATRDRNLQNKARFAQVPYVDVEDDL